MGGVASVAITDTFPLLPSCTCAERAGKSMSSLFMLYKKIFYPRVLVVSSACCVFAHLQNIQHCLACPSVCVLLFVCLCLQKVMQQKLNVYRLLLSLEQNMRSILWLQCLKSEDIFVYIICFWCKQYFQHVTLSCWNF